MSQLKLEAAVAAEAPDCRYQDKHSDPFSSHARILRHVRALAAGASVLDVGAATGMLGRALRGAGLRLTALEPNPAWADAARPWYDRVLCTTVEAAPDAPLAGHDAVVCADVLEHLADPLAVLRRLVSLQAPHTRVIVSVPNVANLVIRLQLLAGRFDYADRGILDRTHLRFFTARTLVALCHDAGLAIDQLEVTPLPLPLVFPAFGHPLAMRTIYRLLDGVSQRLPRLLGYQFVLVARPRPGTLR